MTHHEPPAARDRAGSLPHARFRQAFLPSPRVPT